MPTFDRRNRRDLDQLVEEYITTNNILTGASFCSVPLRLA